MVLGGAPPRARPWLAASPVWAGPGERRLMGKGVSKDAPRLREQVEGSGGS